MEENKMEKTFNLKTMMSLIVGVIAMIVIIPTIALTMGNMGKEKQSGWEFRFNNQLTSGEDVTIYKIYTSDNLKVLSNLYIDSTFIIPNYSRVLGDKYTGLKIVIHNNYTSYYINREDNIYVVEIENDNDNTKRYYNIEGNAIPEGIYDFSIYTYNDSLNNDPLAPIYTPW